MKLRNSFVIAIACSLLTLTFSQQAAGQGAYGFWLTAAPTDPDDRDNITVTIAHEFGSSCFSVCDVTGEWITPTEYHIDWYIRDTSLTPGGGCLTYILTLYSEVHVGQLDPGDYTVTATRHVAQWDEVCTDGVQPLEIQTTFQVVPNIPTVSQWGFVVLFLLLMIASAVCLRRREKLFS